MFGQKRMYNVQLGRNDSLNEKIKQTFDKHQTSAYSVNKRNSHPMFQHPIQNTQNITTNAKEYQDFQLTENHKRFLEQFKQSSYAIQKNISIVNQTEDMKNTMPQRQNIQNQQTNQPQSNQTKKGKLASRFSKIDQLSQEYLSSKGTNQNSETLKFSQQKLQNHEDKNANLNLNLNQNVKMVKSQVIDLEKTTKNYHENCPNKRKTLQDQPNVQSYQTTSQKGQATNFKFFIEILKDLKMLEISQAQMHQDVAIQIGKNRFQQMKQNGKWETMKQYVEFKKIFQIGQKQQKQIQDCEIIRNKKKSSFRSNKSQLTTSNVGNSSNSNKKVKVISPQTLSQFDRKREILQKQLIRATEILTHGFQLKKYCFNTYKIQNVKMVFSFDFCFFALKVEDKFKPTIHSMSEFVNVVSGCKSKNFKRYNEKQPQDIPVDKAFTITFSDRTFDFICSSMAQRDKIVHVIKLMKNSS